MTPRLVIPTLCVSVTLAGCRPEPGASPAPQPAPAPLVLQGPVDHLDGLAREPMVVQHPNGTLFVTGYGTGVPRLWRSTDDGATWARVNVGSEKDGAVGNSDVDLAVAPDGTLYFVVMTYDRKKFEGVQIAVGASRDVGAKWSWT
ncbi:MAG: exo-alpha-sialidase, partial [Acidobacteria bacterium]|nr:exo-alpha-sialidase [Acidobacteriota bacterium]